MKVDVVLCTFNGERHLTAQLQSLEFQTRRPDRLLISDDGSTDETLSIVQRFADRLPIEVSVNPTRLGASANFGRVLERSAQADVILLCDQDDIWFPEKIETLVRALADEPNALLAFSDAQLIDGAGVPMRGTLRAALGAEGIAGWPPQAVVEALLRRNLVTGATAAIRRPLLDFALPMPPGFWHDEWLAMIAASMGALVAVDRPLMSYRIHAANAAGLRGIGARAVVSGAFRGGQEFRRTKAERIARLADGLRMRSGTRPVPFLRVVEDALLHWRARAELPEDLLPRLAVVRNQLRARAYHRYSSGWRSAARDLFDVGR